MKIIDGKEFDSVEGFVLWLNTGPKEEVLPFLLGCRDRASEAKNVKAIKMFDAHIAQVRSEFN
jgi:hypothetical protein